ncbi:hypothetical protein LSH36_711g00024 [Paralvinella palmiformis]|uniref:EGF-like domain-containing protein n=1 Tax=Paralvinella palmiformis TaxID=53620 RepID=A0AAD9J2S2_9ANNE|nr:hypothetical protein LSH36_711g00024 [Paralvinella palmiformis]
MLVGPKVTSRSVSINFMEQVMTMSNSPILVIFVIIGVCKSEDVTLGNNITFGFPLRTDPRAFIFTEIDVPEGTITNIEFYSTGIDIPLTFEIWRQINLTEYQLVTQIQHVTSAVGIQKINLIENKRVISINKRGNTKLGFSMESHDCAISYNVLNIHKGALLTSHLIDQTKGRSLIVGDNYTFTGNLMDKTFSVKWIISTGAVKCEKYNGGCEHLCHQGQGQVACACYPGYQLLSNNRNCLEHHEQRNYFLLHSPDVSLGIIIWLAVLTLLTMAMALYTLRKKLGRCCHQLVPMATRSTSQMNIIEGWGESDNVYNIDMGHSEEMKC